MDKKTELIKTRYNRIARYYDQFEAMMEVSFSKWRKIIWSQAKGRILEAGVGTGRNIPFYPEHTEITAIDFSERMLEQARKKATALNKKVNFMLMDLQNLQLPDESFDTIITSCVFCSVPDPIQGLKELRRVCAKDGQIIMLEHVRSNNPFLGLFMDLINPIVVRMVGANINRNTVANLKKAGFQIEVEENLMMDIVKHLKCRITP